MLAGRNGARGRIRTCTGDALDVVSLLLDYASEMDGASCRCRPGATFLQRKPAGRREEAKWSQSPVLPWTQRAYETCLSAGSTAFGYGDRKSRFVTCPTSIGSKVLMGARFLNKSFGVFSE